MSKQVTAILIGAGARGADAYASYALEYPQELKFVAVAEPREDRRRDFAEKHGIPQENCYASWEELLGKSRMADCVLICTHDQLHFEPLTRAMELGYHILCEKPVTPVKEELTALKKRFDSYGGIISICHVLRYSPFFMKLKELLSSGAIGELVHIQHMESVGYWHMAHSFVRGNWRRKELSSPMILQKCCHDMDILLWLTERTCVRVSSFGSLKHFKKEQAPQGAAQRCTDGCGLRDECPYYAPRFYLEYPKAVSDGFVNVVSLDHSPAGIIKALREGPYGRCVYACDNDVVDHQTVNLEYEGGVTASLTMCAFTSKCERVINLMGTHGQIKGNMEDNCIELLDFATGNVTRITVHTPEGGHSGSDVNMMRHFVELVAADGRGENRLDASEAVESHLIALAAEESRCADGRVIAMKAFQGA